MAFFLFRLIQLRAVGLQDKTPTFCKQLLWSRTVGYCTTTGLFYTLVRRHQVYLSVFVQLLLQLQQPAQQQQQAAVAAQKEKKGSLI